MTKEEAIDYNKNLRMYMKLSDKNQPCKFLEKNYIALDMAIKALEQESYDDCVRRQAVMDCFKKWQYTATRLFDFEKELFSLPSVNPQEPKTGHWIDGVCSECGYIGDEEVFGGKFKYCPNCGAKMEGDKR